MSIDKVDPKNMHKDTDHISEIYKFTQDFFQFFGAEVQKNGRKKIAPLNVTLSPQFASTFGYSTLELVFTPDEFAKATRPEDQTATIQTADQPQSRKPQVDDEIDASAADDIPTNVQADGPKHGVELVARGSRIFDQMLTYLDKRSALTMQRLPSNFTGGQELMAAIRPVNTSIAKLNMEEQRLNLYIYNWHVTYRADDKFEEMLTVAIDDSGTLYPLIGTVGETAKATETDPLHLDQLLSDGEPIEPEIDEDGTVKPPALPPMTELTRLAETSRKYAIYHADVRCVAHEVEVQQRLYRALNRLNNYYLQQIEEVYDSHDQSGEKRSTLEHDLQRKISEEVENHRLRVRVRLFSYAIIQVPIAVADLILTDGKKETAVRVRRNQYSGTIERPPCHACKKETTDVAIDRNGHVTCDECIKQCGTCLDILCADCGVEPCSVCQKENCDTCGKECWACGERACGDHISECPTCRDSVCHTCQSECAECGIRQCRSHLRVDSVLSIGEDEQTEEHALVCASCAVQCLGCSQYSVQIDTCEKSGQRFCKNCLEICHDCGTRAGPDYYIINPQDKEVYCRDCVTVCPMCDSLVAELTACQECGADCCASCSNQCQSCQAVVCADHTMRVGDCGHLFCTAHSKHCAIGSEPVCAICDAVCSICERPYCTHHAESCGLCRCAYCTDCVDDDIDLCHTCATIREDGKVVDLAAEPIAAHPDVAPFIYGYRWSMAANLHYTIYLGEGSFNTGALVLVQNEIDGPPPRNLAPKRQSQSQTGTGKKLFGSLVDRIIGGTDLDSIGENLRRALLNSDLLEDRPDLIARLRSEDDEPTEPVAPKEKALLPASTMSGEMSGPQVLVARKINALDLLWR